MIAISLDMAYRNLIVTIFVLIYIGSCCHCDIISVDPSSNQFFDSYGRQRLFHGANVVYKGKEGWLNNSKQLEAPPYIPIVDHFDFQYSFSEEDMQLFKEWGFNSVR